MMRLHRSFSVVCALALVALLGAYAQAGGIAIGSSSLIGVLDYSDPFTSGVFDTGNPVVTNNYGNPSLTWGCLWGIATDATAVNGYTLYPGTSGVGSDTGITQMGGQNANFGIGYEMRTKFVMQFDAVSSNDRVDMMLGTGTAYNTYGNTTLFQTTNLTVFVRSGQVDIFGLGGTSVTVPGMNPGITAGQWYNYGLGVDLVENTLEVFVNEVSLGVVDLDTFNGGTFASVLASGIDYVGYGYGHNPGDRFWSDNFQVGSPVPEPGTFALLLGALAGVALYFRKKHA
jgi:hypothetical protein